MTVGMGSNAFRDGFILDFALETTFLHCNCTFHIFCMYSDLPTSIPISRIVNCIFLFYT